MKKILVMVLSLIVCFTTLACSCNKVDPVVLEDAQYTTGIGEIRFMESFDPLQEKIDSRSTFVFYMYGATCSGCHRFTPILEEYVEENGINIYAVEVNMVARGNLALKQTLGCTPAIGIIKDGELYQYIDACNKNHTSYFMDKEGLNSWFEKYIVMK